MRAAHAPLTPDLGPKETPAAVGADRTEEAVRPFFTQEMGRRRCHTLQVICMDMWAPYAKLVKAAEATWMSTSATRGMA
jgi:hypothetical protein